MLTHPQRFVRFDATGRAFFGRARRVDFHEVRYLSVLYFFAVLNSAL